MCPAPDINILSCCCFSSRLCWCHSLEGLHYSQRGPAFGHLWCNHPLSTIGNRTVSRNSFESWRPDWKEEIKNKNNETLSRGWLLSYLPCACLWWASRVLEMMTRASQTLLLCSLARTLPIPVWERLGSSRSFGTTAMRLPFRQESGLVPSLTCMIPSAGSLATERAANSFLLQSHPLPDGLCVLSSWPHHLVLFQESHGWLKKPLQFSKQTRI